VEGELAVQALGRLSPRHRQVLSLREGSGWTYQEIASHEGVEIRTVESLIWRARQALKREYAAIASVNSVIGGIALGRWGALRRAGGSLARRMHPVGAVLGSTGGGRGIAATAMALTSFAVVAATVPGSSHAEHHSVAPTAQANAVQAGSRGRPGDSTLLLSGESLWPGRSAVGSAAPTGPGADGQATVSPSASTSGSSTTGSVGIVPAATALSNQGQGQLPSNPIPTAPTTILPTSGSPVLPVSPNGPVVSPLPPLANLNQPTDPATTLPSLPSVPSLPLGSTTLTTPVEGLLGGQ
jgi:hypothetical protein